jgi:hypothetical protein
MASAPSKSPDRGQRQRLVIIAKGFQPFFFGRASKSNPAPRTSCLRRPWPRRAPVRNWRGRRPSRRPRRRQDQRGIILGRLASSRHQSASSASWLSLAVAKRLAQSGGPNWQGQSRRCRSRNKAPRQVSCGLPGSARIARSYQAAAARKSLLPFGHAGGKIGPGRRCRSSSAVTSGPGRQVFLCTAARPRAPRSAARPRGNTEKRASSAFREDHRRQAKRPRPRAQSQQRRPCGAPAMTSFRDRDCRHMLG